MGMTLTTLHLYGVDKDQVAALLDPYDQLRDVNPPWLSVVPFSKTGADDFLRMERIGKRMTKGSAAAALLFYYFDDESFYCRFYREGRKKAECRSDGSWAKLGKKLNELFGDETSSKSFRYASRCIDLEEQIQLLEETAGVSLLEITEDEPRRVHRCDNVLRRIKEREAMIRKRPKRYILTEVRQVDWPVYMRMKEKLIEILRPNWRDYSLEDLLLVYDARQYMVTGCNDHFYYSYFNFTSQSSGIVVYDWSTGCYSVLGPFMYKTCKVLWKNEDDELICLFYQFSIVKDHLWTHRDKGFYYLSSIDKYGNEIRRYDIKFESQGISWGDIYVSDNGLITLIDRGKSRERILRIDGKTGESLCSCSFPADSHLDRLKYVKSIDSIISFVHVDRAPNELVILDQHLNITNRWEVPDRLSSSIIDRIYGTACYSPFPYGNTIRLLDLKSGKWFSIRLEIPVSYVTLLSDGRMIGENDSGKVFTVFDKTGTVVSRLSLRGGEGAVFEENDCTFIKEFHIPGEYAGGLVDEELFYKTRTLIFRLDPAGEK